MIKALSKFKGLLVQAALVFATCSNLNAQDSLNISTHAILFNHWDEVRGIHLVDDNNAFVAVKNHGLAMMSFDLNTNIEEVSTHFDREEFMRLIEYQGFLFTMSNENEISVIDISDQNNPVLVNRWDSGEHDLIYMKINNNYLVTIGIYYGYDWIENWVEYPVEIFSLEDPANPELIASTLIFNEIIADVAVGDDRFFVSNVGFVSEYTLDINSDPINTPLERNYNTSPITGLNYREEFLYAVIGDSMNTYNVSMQNEFELVNTLSLPGSGGTLEDEADEILLWGWESIENGEFNFPQRSIRFDVSNPETPVQSFIQPLDYNYDAAVAVNDLLIGSFDNPASFSINDISDPQSPELLDEYSDSGSIKKAVLIGGYAYVLFNGRDEVIRVNLNSPEAPLIEDFNSSVNQTITGIACSANQLYVNSSNTIYKINLDENGETESINPFQVTGAGTIQNLQVNDDGVIAFWYENEVFILDSDDDGSLHETSSINLNYSNFKTSNSILCALSPYGSLKIYSIENPENVYHLDDFSASGAGLGSATIHDFAIVGSNIFFPCSYEIEDFPNHYSWWSEWRGIRRAASNFYYEYCEMDQGDYRSHKHFFSDGNLLFIGIDGSSLSENGIDIYHIIDFQEPVLLGHYSLGSSYINASFNENGVMIATSERWLQVFDASEIMLLDTEETKLNLPAKFELHQPWPNPFNPSVTINFDLDKPGLVNLSVFNILGQHVHTLVNQNLESGKHVFSWNAQEMASGTYFVRLSQGKQSQVQKLLLMK